MEMFEEISGEFLQMKKSLVHDNFLPIAEINFSFTTDFLNHCQHAEPLSFSEKSFDKLFYILYYPHGVRRTNRLKFC